MHRAFGTLRNGDWLTRERIRVVAAILLIASAAGLLFLVVTAHGDVDIKNRPLGTDFSDVYSAGTYVLQGRPTAPFNPPRQYAREQQLFGANTQFYGWHYPPYFLFIAGALAKMPYGVALVVWQASSLALYLLVIWGIVSAPSLGAAGRGDYLWLLLALAYPAVLINAGHGQNGFLTAALLGGALLVLDARPLLAGLLIGLLVYKPQFGLMIPLALIAGGRWRTFAAATVTVLLLTLAATLAFGPQIWHAFLVSTRFSRTVVLEQGQTGWQKIQSVFSWARMWGAPIPVAYAVQGALTVAVGAGIVWLWRRAAAPPLMAAALCLAAILATPYSLDYDMMVLAPAIAFFAADGIARGFNSWEKTALAALWLVPLVTRSIAGATLIPLGVPAMLAMFAVILRRAELDRTLPVAFAARSSTMPQARPAGGHDIAAFE